MLPFTVIPGPHVRRILSASRHEVVEAVKRAYVQYHEGEAINPPSQFLRFPDNPTARIIGLPAFLGGPESVAGVKWIASFPQNVEKNLPRASAVMLLNDVETGYPFACLEASQISAARTAASAVLAAEVLTGGRPIRSAAFVGCGIIARNVLEYLAERSPQLECVMAHDADQMAAESFVSFARAALQVQGDVARDIGTAIAGADIVVLATTASTPHLHDPRIFGPGQVVLHLSLRDLDPAVILSVQNVVDDVDHCLTQQTSLHLTELAVGSRSFVNGTLAEYLLGKSRIDRRRTTVFSPFGLGILDLAVAQLVHRIATATGATVPVADFFAETIRWDQSRLSEISAGVAP